MATPPRKLYFVRGVRPDGSRWDSALRHTTREAAEAELKEWTPRYPDDRIKIMIQIPRRR